EDGIRCFHVTGVQTCALPIYRCTADLSAETLSPGARKLLVALPLESKLVVLDAQEILSRQPGTYGPCHVEAELILSAEVPDAIRSEERRVGKEGSGRW